MYNLIVPALHGIAYKTYRGDRFLSISCFGRELERSRSEAGGEAIKEVAKEEAFQLIYLYVCTCGKRRFIDSSVRRTH